MRFRSAKDDLRATTLEAVSGPVAQLGYLASLRAEGRYQHWGLAKVHGKEAAEAALLEAHREVAAQLLRQPLAELYDEIESVGRLLDHKPEELLPAETDALERAHFSLVWDVIASVARRHRSRLPAA